MMIPARAAGALAMLFLLFMGSLATMEGVRCTVHGRTHLSQGAHRSWGRDRTREVSDRTRLYGPGVTPIGLSALAAAVMLPVVPSRTWRNGRPQWTLPWRVVGYAVCAGLVMAMISVVAP